MSDATQDEAFEQWRETDMPCHWATDAETAGSARAGWDARGEHDAAELAHKDELLKAYRALNAAGIRL